VSEYAGPLPGEVRCTRLNTGSTDERTQLGLQLVGRLVTEVGAGCDELACFGVFVAGILPGSIADHDASIHVGDQLLQVACPLAANVD